MPGNEPRPSPSMRLEAMTVGVLREVLGTYVDVAYSRGLPDTLVVPELPSDDTPLGDVLADVFVEERGEQDAAPRYTLRLGNDRYPFMKIVLQEHLVEDEFFFGVDTHDQMFAVDGPEADRFAELKRHNMRVKQQVEDAWNARSLPTAAQLKGLVETRPAGRSEHKGRRVLVVDDDRDIARTLALMLEARGYDVEVLGDGRDCVEQADPDRHDLILMDNEMPDLDGFEACRLLKASPRTRDIPVLIATAGERTLEQLEAADGFMVKPFRIDLLYALLDDMLELNDRG